jgi:hypothetical protein
MPFIKINDKNILFIHIPKTGGTSIEESMAKLSELNFSSRAILNSCRVSPEHFTFSDYESLFQKDFFSYTFTIVRDPYKRIESEYKMRAILSKQSFFGKIPKFSIWLEDSLNRTKHDVQYLNNHFRPQIHFLSKKMRIFKYENGLDAVIRNVNLDLKTDIALCETKHLSSTRFDGSIEWTSQNIRSVNEFYNEDFTVLNYKKLDPGFSV